MPPYRKLVLWLIAASLLGTAGLLALRRCGRPAPALEAETRAEAPAPRPEFVRELPAPDPEILLISTSRRRAAYLLKQLCKERPDARGRIFEVLEAGATESARIAAELEKVPGRGIKYVIFDGDVSEPGDPLTAPVLKKLTSAGIHTSCVEFVE